MVLVDADADADASYKLYPWTKLRQSSHAHVHAVADNLPADSNAFKTVSFLSGVIQVQPLDSQKSLWLIEVIVELVNIGQS